MLAVHIFSLTLSISAQPIRCLALPEASKRGITLRGLKSLRALLVQLTTEGRFGDGLDFNAVTTEDFVYTWVKDAAVTGVDRLIDCPDFIDPKDIRPHLFRIARLEEPPGKANRHGPRLSVRRPRIHVRLDRRACHKPA
jgi:hypothetical protein